MRSPMTDEEVQRLEGLGVKWDMLAETWEANFGLLEVYQRREGHCNVPQGHVEDGVKLGTWLTNQRQRYKARGMDEAERKKKTNRSPLRDEEVRRLEGLGVKWDMVAETWEAN